MNYETIAVDSGPVTWITLNRPKQRNAINRQMQTELLSALSDAESDSEVRVSVIKGNGPCFSAGDDVYEAAEQYLAGSRGAADSATGREIDLRIWQDMRKPIIGAIHGYVGPLAVRILHVLDLAVAAEGTTLSYEHLRIGGTVPSLIPTLTMGHQKVKEWQLLGGIFTAQEAEKHGLINKVVPLDKLYETAEGWAQAIVGIPSQAALANKHLINQVYEMVGVRTMYTLAASLNGVAQDANRTEEFFELAKSKGLKAALQFRDQQIKQS